MKLSTDLIGINQFCTYWGHGNSEYTLHEDMIKEDFEEGNTDIHPDYYQWNFDNEKYMMDWDEAVQNFLGEYIIDALKYNLGGEWEYIAEGYNSPREYNFRGDWNLFTLNGDWNLVFDYCRAHKDFAQFLADHYTSCDGFCSFTANNLSEWEEDVLKEDGTAYGAGLRFFLEKEAPKVEDSMYDVFQDMFYSEYVDYTPLKDFLKELESAEGVDLDEEWKRELFNRNKVGFVYAKANEMYLEGMTPEEIAEKFFGEYNQEYVVKQINDAWKLIDSQTEELEL